MLSRSLGLPPLLVVGCVIATIVVIGQAAMPQRSAVQQDRIQIAPGVYMPLVNLGIGNHTQWFQAGGRGADTAYDYGTEQKEVGRAIQESGIDRSEVFVTTKVPCCPAKFWCATGESDASGPRWWQWPPVGPEHADGAFLAENDLMRIAEHDLDTLGLEYIDLILLHMPCATHELSLARYQVLEELHRKGKARAIGVANFDASQLEALVAKASVKPAVNQFGYSVGTPWTVWMQDEGDGDRTKRAVAKARALNVTVMAYGPLGQTTGQGVQAVIHNPTVAAIAQAHGVSGAQVALRYLVQQGIAVVTGGSNPKHMAEDVAVPRFQLSTDEMALLQAV